MLLRQSHRRSRQCFRSFCIVRNGGRSHSTAVSRKHHDIIDYNTACRLPFRQQRKILFSSEAVFSSKVPDYLIPPAYRTRSSDEDSDRGRGRGRNIERRGVRSGSAKRRSRSGGRSNNNSKQTRKQSKHRRKSNRSLYRNKRNVSVQNVDVRQLEKDLAIKFNVFNERLGEISSGNFGAFVDKNAKEEEAEQLSSSKGIFLSQDESDGVNVADLLATEDLYTEIASDLDKLIMGYADIAETACNAQIARGRDKHEDEEEAESDSSAAMLSHYLDAIMKAERYLETLEMFYKNRIDDISKAKVTLERQQKLQRENDAKVLGKISSFLGDVFLLNNSTKDSSFEESWKRADGKIIQSSTSNAQRVTEITLDNIDEFIVSHKSIEYIPKTTMYVEQLILANQMAYCFGVDEKVNSVQRSNRLLHRWISTNFSSMTKKTSGTGAAPSLACEENIVDSSVLNGLFHSVIRQNSDLSTIEGVKQAEDWIEQMHLLRESGWKNCSPDVDAYNIVLLGLCNLCKPISSKHAHNENRISKRQERSRRKFILEMTEKLSTKLTELYDMDIYPNILSLNLALNALAKAGRDGDVNVCKIANRVLLKVIGEENFRNIVVQAKRDESLGDYEIELEPHVATKSSVKPNMDTHHWLVDIYSSSGDSFYVNLGVSLLKKMIEHRLDEQSRHLFREGSTASFAPSTGTYNNILRALSRKDTDTASSSDKKSVEVKTAIAKEATDFLDSMIRHETSYPTRVTFVFLLQLWRKTGSAEAGEYADKILSRMEAVSMYQRDLKPFSNGYTVALDCWYTAASAGYTGAAERAFRLFQIIEGKSGEELISDDQEDKEEAIEGASPNKRIYHLMMKICAATKNKEDTPRSMAIAFDVLKLMEENGMTPRHKIFLFLYETVQNYLKHHPGEEGNDLLREVFVTASKYGVKAPELKNRAGRGRV